jgi:hypothetical protein
LDLTQGSPIGMYLSHQYSEKTLQYENLKGNDALYFTLFSRNPKYKVSLVPVKIYALEIEHYEENQFHVVVGENQNAFLLNDWVEAKLKMKDYKRIETGNEGTEISFHYCHGAILISYVESYSPKKCKVDLETFQIHIDSIIEMNIKLEKKKEMISNILKISVE